MRSLIYCILAGFLFAGLAGCAAGKAFSTGERLEAEGNYEEAMLSYAQAYRLDPEAMLYRMKFLETRERAADNRYSRGLERLRAKDYAGALTDFQVAYGLNPGKQLYKQMSDSTAKKRDAQQTYREGMEFEKDNKLKYASKSYERALELDPEESEYGSALERVRAQLDNRPSKYELNIKSLKPFAFKFTGSGLKDVFRILTQLSGINFIFDEGVRDQPVTINLERTNFQQVLDLLTTMNKLGTTILNEKTVLIFPNTAEKNKQYEELELRTFHLNFMDAKKAINLIRTMLPTRKIYVNEEVNSVVVRDTSEVISVVGSLLEANDIPDAEVLLDVEVIEINDRDTKNVGLVLSRYGVDIAGFDTSSGQMLADRLSNVVTGDNTSNAGVNNLVNVFTWNGYGGFVTVPSATYNFGKVIAKGEVLSNPKIRVKNKEKAKFTVGTRVPITTTSSTGTVGGVTVNVQYVDVGVKLNAEPLVQLNNVIDIKLSLEVSSILNRETVGSDELTTVVTIGTRNLETVLSLKDGETSVIGGLKARTNSDAQSKIYLLGDIPIIGPFISGNVISKEKTELVLAITPHLVRGLTTPAAHVASFMSGKEDNPTLKSFPPATDDETGAGAEPVKGRPGVVPPQPGAGAAQATVSPTPLPRPGDAQHVPAGAAPPQPMMPAAALPGTTQQVPPLAVPVTPPVAPEPAAANGGGTPEPDAAMKGGQLIISSPAGAKVGEQFTLDLRAANVDSVSAATFVLSYDAGLVEPVSFTAGDFLKQPGVKTSFSSSVDPAAGRVSVSLALPPGSPGVSGGGVMARAVFRARKQGTAAFGFMDTALRTPDARQIPVVPFATSIGIQ